MSAPLAETRFRVEGMDCAACATKIDTAVRRVAGVEDVAVSVMAGTMTVRHAPAVDLDGIAGRVDALGYKAAVLGTGEAAPDVHGGHNHEHDHAHDHDHEHEHGDPLEGLHGHDHGPTAGPWWGTRKARLTALAVFAVGIGFGLSALLPAYAGWIFALAMLVGLVPIARRAFAGAVQGSPFTIETLMTVAAIGAVIIGAAEEAAVVVVLFLVGELLEGIAASRARASISALSELVPATALRERGGGTETVPGAALVLGDVILVRPGDRIAADGVVIAGDSAVDEAPVTGESVPRRRGAGDSVYAGTVNGEALLRVRVTAAAADNTIARIVRLVEEAQESKAPTERFIERFARVYTPGVMVVAALVAIVPPLFGASWNEWIYKGLAVLLIGCPCALVISTPAAIAAALSAGARRGLLLKGGAVLERLGAVDRVAFDKTGTLTEGRPVVTDIVAFGRGEAEVLRLAAALEQGSSHPLAKAILLAAETRGIRAVAAESKAVPGSGVAGIVDGAEVFLGAADDRLDAQQSQQVQALAEAGKTVSVLVVDGAVAGLIAMRDEPRADAVAGLAALRALGVEAVMLTGDNPRTAAAIGGALGLEVRAGLLPQDKQRIVNEIKAQGHVVAKVGDGINDAPALAAADVGIAMGGGTDVALETADAAVLHGRVGDVAQMIALSRTTRANIAQNIAISLGLKAFFLVTTVIGVTGLWPAILADTGATVLVTLNAMRLLGWRGR